MDEGSAGGRVIRRMVREAWSLHATSPDPDDPIVREVLRSRLFWSKDELLSDPSWRDRIESGEVRSSLAAVADSFDPRVRGFAEFGLSPGSPLANEDGLRILEGWRRRLGIPANSAFLDGTLLQTVWALLSPDHGPDVLTPVTLWELATFIDALVCFDRLYCIDSPDIDVAGFNRLLGTEILSAVPDPFRGPLHLVATYAAWDGRNHMYALAERMEPYDQFGEEILAVAKGWQAVLGADLPSGSPFDTSAIDRLSFVDDKNPTCTPEFRFPPIAVATERSAILSDGSAAGGPAGLSGTLQLLIGATRVSWTLLHTIARPPLDARRQFAAMATYRTYVNQGVANALAVPYLPGTVRMPFRRFFVRRAAEIQDELATIALADRVFAQQQPSSPLIMPFFTSAVLQRASTRADIWVQMAHVREQSASFRSKRGELDALLERSQVSPDALRLQAAIRDEGLKMADLAGVAQQSASVALGVIAQTSIVPLVGAMKVGIDAAQGVGRDSGWTRVWRRLFHRHEYFLAQANSQAIALTNAVPQLQRLWEMPKVGGYLNLFARTTQKIGRTLRES